MNTSMPLSQTPPQSWLARATEHHKLRLNRRTVLIADDQADSIEALALLVEWSGREVLRASDGKQALLLARKYQPELIFLDIAMPEVSGYEVCQRLRALPEFAEARIYAITAFTGAAHDARRSDAGFTGQLTKPIDPEVLEALLH
jgi:CheY-like chemotaxis protein